jgi:hypothetical protein
MTIEIRPYQDSDYSMVAEWWRAWGWEVLTPDYLPPIGAIVTVEGIDTCAAWLYRTDSSFALIEWVISNPRAKKRRKQALAELIGHLCWRAKNEGYKSVVSMVSHPSLIANMERLGFEGRKDGMTNLIRRL